MAVRLGVTAHALALAWVLSHPLVTAAIVGPRRASHLDVVAEALHLRLRPDEREELAGLFDS
jgi:aryl-alcohol dehydrogenase-like predicted oxidoreductase